MNEEKTTVKVTEKLVAVPKAPAAAPPARPLLKNVSEHLVEVRTPHDERGGGFYVGLRAGASVEIPESEEAAIRSAVKDNSAVLAIVEPPAEEKKTAAPSKGS